MARPETTGDTAEASVSRNASDRRPATTTRNPAPSKDRHMDRPKPKPAESDKSVPHILRANPDLPHFKTIFNWQQRIPWFHDMWKQARIRQTHFLADKCLDLYNAAEPKTAHVVRIKFDVLRWLAAKFNPTEFGDKPIPSQQSTTVNVGISISPQRLDELRGKLEHTRTAFQRKPALVNQRSQPENTSPTDGNNHD
jgi:hypothetical protein